MVSLFKRIGDNIRANVNAALDKAEDPVKLLNQYLLDMEDDIADAEGALAKQLVVVRKFKAQYEEATVAVEKREAQALEALRQGREDLARRALEDKKLHKARATDYQTHYEKSNETADHLKSQLREMKDEYEKLRAKRDTLAARAQAAQAQKSIASIVGSFSTDGGRRGFDRMEHKVMQMEAEAQVAADVNGLTKALDDELAALNDADIDHELEELKARLNLE